MASDNFQGRRQTPQIILSRFVSPYNGNKTYEHNAKKKSELKLIKTRSDDDKVTILFWN